MKAGRKKPALKRAARAKLASLPRRDARRIGRREAVAQQRFGGPLTGREREVDPFARDRVDEPGGVAGEQPARSGERRRRRASRAASDGIGHEYGSSRAPAAMPVARIHCGGPRAERRRRDARSRPARRCRSPGGPGAETTRCSRADRRSSSITISSLVTPCAKKPVAIDS